MRSVPLGALALAIAGALSVFPEGSRVVYEELAFPLKMLTKSNSSQRINGGLNRNSRIFESVKFYLTYFRFPARNSLKIRYVFLKFVKKKLDT